MSGKRPAEKAFITSVVNEQVYTETLGTFLIPPIESGFDDDEVTIMKIFTEQRLLKLSSRRDSVIQWCGQKKCMVEI